MLSSLYRSMQLGAKLMLLIGFCVSCASAPVHEERTYALCTDVLVLQKYDEDEGWEHRISLTDNEKLLVCGDPEAKDSQYRAWSEIPFNQAKFHFSTFLQSRGYYQAEFRREAGHLLVDLGPRTVVNAVETQGAPGVVDISRRRGVLLQPLTPLLLDDLEFWVRSQLRSEGYPCPRVEASADPKTGKVIIRVDAREELPLIRIIEEPIEGMDPQMLRRYDAFQLGDPYDADLLTLTSRRILDEGIVQSAYFTESCEADGAVANQITVAGAPRLLVFGAGIDAEGFIRLRASWKNTRLGRSASTFEITARGSSLEQALDATLTWYHLGHPSRRFIRPAVEIRRRDEEPYEILSREIRIAPGTTWDGRGLGFEFEIGPAYEWLKTYRGVGPVDSKFLSLESALRVESHDFEYFRSSPRTGYSFQLATDFNSRSLGSDLSAQKVQLRGEALWNFRNYDPPLLVFGFRSGFHTTLTNEEDSASGTLPPVFYSYLGGSQDLRGFGRNELELGGDVGGLSAAFAGVELRVATPISNTLQPFGFIDAGALGNDSFQLQSPIFWSPGIGVRWEAAFGTLRGSLAHGFVSGEVDSDLSHWQFYFSFGEEF